MWKALAQAFENELRAGYRQMAAGDYCSAYRHFERAHILGQRRVLPHTRSHWAFLRWAIGQRDVREFLGQCLRIPAGILGSAIGWVPTGNTGGARVSALARMPIPEDLQQFLD